jgi:hypothetical protein
MIETGALFFSYFFIEMKPILTGTKIEEQRETALSHIRANKKKLLPGKKRFYLDDPDLLFRSARKRLIFFKAILS